MPATPKASPRLPRARVVTARKRLLPAMPRGTHKRHPSRMKARKNRAREVEPQQHQSPVTLSKRSHRVVRTRRPCRAALAGRPNRTKSSQAPCVPNESTQGQNQVQGPGQMQKPAQSRNGQVTNPRETPQKKAVEAHPEEPQEKATAQPLWGFAVAARSLYSDSIRWRQAAALWKQRFYSRHGKCERTADGSARRPDYVLGPGDSLIVNMWGAQSNRLSQNHRSPRPD